MTAVTDDAGRRHDYEWCNLNRVRRVRFPEVTLASGNTFRPVKEFEYDSENRLTAVRLPGGELVRYEYATHLPRPTRVSYPDGRVQVVGRNARGFVTSLTENGELVFRQDVDSAGRVTRRVTGDGEELKFEYDPMGRLAVAEADECSLQITRDALGRVTAETWDHGAVGFAYDEPDAFRRDDDQPPRMPMRMRTRTASASSWTWSWRAKAVWLFARRDARQPNSFTTRSAGSGPSRADPQTAGRESRPDSATATCRRSGASAGR